MKKPMTVTLLGAQGLVGRHLAARLREAGQLSRRAGRSATADVVFDWQLPATYAPTLQGADAVYLVPPALVDDASQAVSEFLRVARMLGVRRVVAVSSLGAGFSTEPANSGRLRMEHAVLASDMEAVLLRPSGFMQNFSEGFMLPGIIQAGVLVSAAGDGKVAFIDARDIAEVAVAALSSCVSAGQTLALTGSRALGFAEVAHMIGSLRGEPVRYQRVSLQDMARVLHSAGVPDDYARVLLRDQLAIHNGEAAAVHDGVPQTLGRAPRSFESFAAQAVSAWRNPPQP